MGRLPENVAVPLDSICLSLADGPHPFETANRGAIAENWRRETEARPKLFDGRLALFAGHEFRDGVLSAVCHIVRYSTFLYWRRIEPVKGAEHMFAHAVPVTRDNRLVAIRMGAHTANPGQVYFAAGSFEPADIRGGRIDIEANMAREVGEETGLDLGESRAEPRYSAWRFGGQTVLFRRYFFDLDAPAAERLIVRHIENDPDPEIDGVVLIKDSCALPAGLTSYMPGIIRRHFDDYRPRKAGPGSTEKRE